MKFSNLLTDDAVGAELGRRLAQLRLARGWTQAQLALEAGVSKSTVERLEGGGSTQFTNLVRCLRALDRLEGLERLAPEAAPSPIDLLERHGKARRRARRSAARGTAKTAWTWADGG